MDFVALLLFAALMIYMIIMLLGKDIFGPAAIVTAIMVSIIGVFILIKLARKRKAIKRFYEFQLKNSPAVQLLYNEALMIIKENYPSEAQRTIPACAAVLDLPPPGDKSIFRNYYRGLYNSIEGLATLYTQKKLWPSRDLYNYCDKEIVLKYDNMSLKDEAMLTKYPWLISLSLTTVS